MHGSEFSPLLEADDPIMMIRPFQFEMACRLFPQHRSASLSGIPVWLICALVFVLQTGLTKDLGKRVFSQLSLVLSQASARGLLALVRLRRHSFRLVRVSHSTPFQRLLPDGQRHPKNPASSANFSKVPTFLDRSLWGGVRPPDP